MDGASHLLVVERSFSPSGGPQVLESPQPKGTKKSFAASCFTASGVKGSWQFTRFILDMLNRGAELPRRYGLLGVTSLFTLLSQGLFIPYLWQFPARSDYVINLNSTSKMEYPTFHYSPPPPKRSHHKSLFSPGNATQLRKFVVL